MKSVEEYAIDLVADGAEDHAEDDMNEDDEISGENHRKACDLALLIARAIRTYPAEVLALAQRVEKA